MFFTIALISFKNSQMKKHCHENIKDCLVDKCNLTGMKSNIFIFEGCKRIESDTLQIFIDDNLVFTGNVENMQRIKIMKEFINYENDIKIEIKNLTQNDSYKVPINLSYKIILTRFICSSDYMYTYTYQTNHIEDL